MVRHPHRFAMLVFAGVLALWLGVMFTMVRRAALTDQATGPMMVVFEPGISEDAAFAAITRAGAKPIRKMDLNFIWLVEGSAGDLARQGALGSYRELPFSPTIAGCVAVADAKVADAFGL
jgi:hypothetical protein